MKMKKISIGINIDTRSIGLSKRTWLSDANMDATARQRKTVWISSLYPRTFSLHPSALSDLRETNLTAAARSRGTASTRSMLLTIVSGSNRISAPKNRKT